MAHHKRRRPKNRRAGCLMCKPHKANGVDPAKELSRTGKQEARGRLLEAEGRAEAQSSE